MSIRTLRSAALQLVSSGEEPRKAEEKQAFIELGAKGLSYAKIAKRLKVSKSTLANWSLEFEETVIPPPHDRHQKPENAG